MDRSQREYFLRQQLKAIQKELGEGDDLERRSTSTGRRQKRSVFRRGQGGVDKQLKRLATMHPETAETRSCAPGSTG